MADSFVYFLQPANAVTEPVKIGCSALATARAAQLQCWSPHPLALLATAPGDVGDEGAVHRLFAASRYRGEWFWPSSDLMAFIETVKATGRLPASIRSIRLPPGAERLHQYKCHFAEIMDRQGWTVQMMATGLGVTVAKVRGYRSTNLPAALLLPFIELAAEHGLRLKPSDVFSVPAKAA